MSLYVVDVSVGVKWFVPEVGTPDAFRLKSGGHDLHVPALFDVECANVVWKKLRRGVLSRIDADGILAQLPALPLVRHDDLPRLSEALDLADATGRTVYDCLYLALARHLGGVMVTADERLCNALVATPWGGFVQLLRTVP